MLEDVIIVRKTHTEAQEGKLPGFKNLNRLRSSNNENYKPDVGIDIETEEQKIERSLFNSEDE